MSCCFCLGNWHELPISLETKMRSHQTSENIRGYEIINMKKNASMMDLASPPDSRFSLYHLLSLFFPLSRWKDGEQA